MKEWDKSEEQDDKRVGSECGRGRKGQIAPPKQKNGARVTRTDHTVMNALTHFAPDQPTVLWYGVFHSTTRLLSLVDRDFSSIDLFNLGQNQMKARLSLNKEYEYRSAMSPVILFQWSVCQCHVKARRSLPVALHTMVPDDLGRSPAVSNLILLLRN